MYEFILITFETIKKFKYISVNCEKYFFYFLSNKNSGRHFISPQMAPYFLITYYVGPDLNFADSISREWEVSDSGTNPTKNINYREPFLFPINKMKFKLLLHGFDGTSFIKITFLIIFNFTLFLGNKVKVYDIDTFEMKIH
ncbi:hypothetical protein BpHYR1_034394 [Brachionus plicatilis]|uniref:Uncharacterized protein n=1 Tax=Brachionus plicatilis TaxID=10195 RepID=A0A3M7SW28_BRAPC|nr:hypothetical protein BpHYR1_034394 [Brachionus plicatilis]